MPILSVKQGTKGREKFILKVKEFDQILARETKSISNWTELDGQIMSVILFERFSYKFIPSKEEWDALTSTAKTESANPFRGEKPNDDISTSLQTTLTVWPTMKR